MSARAHEDLDCMRARVVLRCGECDTCRQVVATVWAFDAYERRLARERDEIADALRRLERVGDVDLLA